jgi:hypothetical protein
MVLLKINVSDFFRVVIDKYVYNKMGGGRKKEHTLAPPYQQLPVCTQIGCGDRDTVSVIHDTDQDFSTLFSLNTLELTDTKYTLTNTRFNYMCYT